MFYPMNPRPDSLTRTQSSFTSNRKRIGFLPISILVRPLRKLSRTHANNHTHTHVCTRTHTHTLTHSHTQALTHTRTCAHSIIHVYSYTHTRTHSQARTSKKRFFFSFPNKFKFHFKKWRHNKICIMVQFFILPKINGCPNSIST